MAQTVAVSGNSASESSWETASGVSSSPACSTGGSQLVRLPATPAWGRERTADAGLDMAADGACVDTTRAEAAAVAAKRKQPDGGAAEEGPALKQRGSGRALSTTSSERTSSGSEGRTSENRPFSRRYGSSEAGASAGGEQSPRELLAALDAAADAQEAATSGATDWDWALESAVANLLARAAAPAVYLTRQPAGSKAESLQLPLLQTQPQLISTAPETVTAVAASAAVVEAEQATVRGSSGVGSTALERVARRPLPGGLSTPTATQGPPQGSQSQAPTPAFSIGDQAQVHSEGLQLALLWAQNAALQEKARAATAQAATLQRLLDSERAATAGVRRLVEEKQVAAASHRSAARRCAAREAAQQVAEADARDARAQLASAKAELARKEAAVLKAVQGLLDAAS